MRRLLPLLLALFCSVSATAQDKPGAIKARGKPGRAGVFVDGKYVGPAVRFTVPEKYTVEPGEREIRISDPRYEDYTTKVTVQPGKTAKISFKLKPVPTVPPPYGRLRFGGGESESFISVTAGDTSPVYINDKFYGYVDEMNNRGSGWLMPPGTYRIKCSSPIHGEIDQQVTVEANKVTVIPLKQR
jgi:hypothetical protein